MNENEDTNYQDLWNTEKVVSRRKVTTIWVYIRKQAKLEVNITS